MSTTSVQVDPKDVALVEALEPQVRSLIEDIRAAKPALMRLWEAAYPGAGVHHTLRDAEPDLRLVLEDLEDFRIAAGDQAALDYQVFCVRGDRLNVDDDELAWELGPGVERIDALKRYAAKVK